MPSIEDRGSRSDRPHWPLTLTYDLDLQSHASYGHDPHTHKLKLKGQSVKKIEWKQTDRRTDGQTDANDYFIFPANAVGEMSRRPFPISRGNSSLKLSGWHVLKGSQIFTCQCCHPHAYPRMEWAILPLLPSRRASSHFGRYSFPVPQRVGGWVGLGGWLHTEIVGPMPARRRSPIPVSTDR